MWTWKLSGDDLERNVWNSVYSGADEPAGLLNPVAMSQEGSLASGSPVMLSRTSSKGFT